MAREWAVRAQHDQAFGRRLSSTPLSTHCVAKWWRWLRGKPLYRPGDGRVLAAEPEQPEETTMTPAEREDEYRRSLAEHQQRLQLAMLQQNIYAQALGSGLLGGCLLGGALGGVLGAMPQGPTLNELLEDKQRMIGHLYQIIHELQHERAGLLSQRAADATLIAELDKSLKQLIALAHPDKWPGNPLAHEITAALNAIRERLHG